MPAQNHAPAPVWALALVALAPFPAAALAYAFGPNDAAAPALAVLLTWSATVLAFLGGVRWGLESAQPEPRTGRLAFSVLAPLAGWALVFALGAVEPAWLICGLIAAFLLQWLFDHAGHDQPSRYPRLTTVLTGGACVSLAMDLERALTL